MKTAIGLMSGTSMDGIDVALLKTDGENQIEFGPTMAVEYTAAQRNRIIAALDDAQKIEERDQRPGCLGEVERLITDLHGEAVSRFLNEHSLPDSEIDLIGFHGQTVLHRPDQGLTVQLGDGEALAKAVGIDVVYDMRAADMVAGGQGAPLVPVFHQALAHQFGDDDPVAFVNIGGISNITYVGRANGGLIAFDTGPGNALLDQWMESKAGIPFDQGGKIASEGAVINKIAERYLASSYFERSLPKSLDRADFKPLETTEAELSDGARTLAYITAASIIRSCDHLPEPPKRWIICGGGRLNKAIMNDLSTLAAGHNGSVISSDEIDLDGDMLEAQAFAYLAVRSAKNLPLTFPGTTGCKQPTCGGTLAPAKNDT